MGKMNKDYFLNVVTITEDNGSFYADKTYEEINRGYAKGKGVIAYYSGMMIPLVAVDNGYYFAAEILGKYILIVISSLGVTCTVTEAGSDDSGSDESASES